jgi:ribosomal protein L11 methyltransferase
MQWIELSQGCGADQVQEISAILEKYGQGGAAVEEWEEANSERKHYLIKIYLPLSRVYRTLKSEIETRLDQAGYQPALQEKVLQQDEWFESLRKNFKVMEIGEHFVVKPSWTTETLNYPGRVIIEMDPGAAFGTGLHPTTRLCLLNLYKYLKPGMRVFDLGTGTGILAIAAVKLGAQGVVACDIDNVAVKAAQANAGINQVDQGILFKRGTLSRAAQTQYRDSFDIVLANITSRAIADLSTALAAILKPQGVLIVSGIHPAGLDEVLIRLSLAELTLIDVERELEWYAVIARKPNREVELKSKIKREAHK